MIVDSSGWIDHDVQKRKFADNGADFRMTRVYPATISPVSL
jgi:hypothetical protein